MDQLEDKLGAILGNPQMMQQIMSMAQSLGGNESNSPLPPVQQHQDQGFGDFDPTLLKSLSSLAGKGSIDRNQQALLSALNPYLSRRKVEKLEKAMRAAKMARMASGFLGQGGLSGLLGR